MSEAVCPRQGHFSKAACQGCCQWLLVNLSKSRLLSMATCSSQSYLLKSMATCQSKDCLSKSKAACQRLLVQGRATCPSQGRLSKQKLLVQVKAVTCQVCLSMTACPSQGYLLVNGHCPSQGCLSGATLSEDTSSEVWLLVQVMAAATCQAKALLPTAASAVWRGSCTGIWDGKGRGERAG